MSATNRSANRNKNDYYNTPIRTINDFLKKFKELEPEFNFAEATILDPAAGGDSHNQMPYPSALKSIGCTTIHTVDIRGDSLAEIKVDYLKWYPKTKYDMVITNPPFTIALDFVAAALDDVKENGFVVMLLRLNFFGSIKRRYYLQNNMPAYCIVHSNRPQFTSTGSDSAEYAHFVWKKGYREGYTKTYLI